MPAHSCAVMATTNRDHTMADPIPFDGQTAVFGAPKGMPKEDCIGLPVRTGVLQCPSGRHDLGIASQWKLTPDELAEVARTGIIHITCVGVQPPMMVTATPVALRS